MTHFLLAALFLVSLAAPVFGLDLSLAPGLSVKNLFLYGVGTALILETALTRSRHLELPEVIVPLAALLGYALLSWLVIVLIIDFERYDPVASLVKLKATLGDYLLVFLVYFYGPTTAKRSISLLRWMTSVIVVGNILSVLDGLNLPDLGLIITADDGRLAGLLPHPVEYGNLVAFFLPATLALYVSSKGPVRIFALAGIVGSLLAFLMAGSRGPFVGLFAGIAIGCVVLRRYISARHIIKVGVLGAALMVVVLATLFATEYGDMLRGRLIGQSTGTVSYISSGRTEIWGLALAKMLQYPITFVTGFGWDIYDSSRWIWAATHSLYLNLLFNTGLIGLTLFMLAGGNMVRRANNALRQPKQEGASYLVATIFGLLIIFSAAMFSDVVVAMFYVWAFSGTAMRLAVSSRAKNLARDQASSTGSSGAGGSVLSSTARDA